MPPILLIGFLALVQSSEQPADAPFTVVAARTTRSGGEVIVSLGVDSSRARLVRQATLVTHSGVVPATLVRTKRVCENLCPGSRDNGRVCHFEAVLRTAEAVRNAIGVLPGTHEVRNVIPLRTGPDQKIERLEDWLHAESISGNESQWQWVQFPDGVYLTQDDYGRDFYTPPIALAACVKRLAPPFTVLACPGAELLYEGTRGIAASFAEYSEQAAHPEVTFQLDKRDAALIRLGLKGETVVALIVRDNGRWRMTYRGADHPLIC